MLRKRTESSPLLTVVIPVFNERETIERVVKAVRESSIKSLELIVVDDGSTDGTPEKLQQIKKHISTMIRNPINQGKGAALRAGIAAAKGQIVLIQDADLEYDPQDYQKLIKPIVDGRADVVYGSRFVGSDPHRVVFFWHYLANICLTCLSNVFNNLNLTDMETGYKVFRRTIIQPMQLQENGFGIEPELTAKLAAQKARIYEVGISYHGRTYDEGKKIGLSDALRAVYVILYYGIKLKFKQTKANIEQRSP